MEFGCSSEKFAKAAGRTGVTGVTFDGDRGHWPVFASNIIMLRDGDGACGCVSGVTRETQNKGERAWISAKNRTAKPWSKTFFRRARGIAALTNGA